MTETFTASVQSRGGNPEKRQNMTFYETILFGAWNFVNIHSFILPISI